MVYASLTVSCAIPIALSTSTDHTHAFNFSQSLCGNNLNISRLIFIGAELDGCTMHSIDITNVDKVECLSKAKEPLSSMIAAYNMTCLDIGTSNDCFSLRVLLTYQRTRLSTRLDPVHEAFLHLLSMYNETIQSLSDRDSLCTICTFYLVLLSAVQRSFQNASRLLESYPLKCVSDFETHWSSTLNLKQPKEQRTTEGEGEKQRKSDWDEMTRQWVIEILNKDLAQKKTHLESEELRKKMQAEPLSLYFEINSTKRFLYIIKVSSLDSIGRLHFLSTSN